MSGSNILMVHWPGSHIPYQMLMDRSTHYWGFQISLLVPLGLYYQLWGMALTVYDSGWYDIEVKDPQ